MFSDEIRRALEVWRAIFLLTRVDRLCDAARLGEMEELGKRLRTCLDTVEREGTEGSAASVARATLNRMAKLLGDLRRPLVGALRL